MNMPQIHPIRQQQQQQQQQQHQHQRQGQHQVQQHQHLYSEQEEQQREEDAWTKAERENHVRYQGTKITRSVSNVFENYEEQIILFMN